MKESKVKQNFGENTFALSSIPKKQTKEKSEYQQACYCLVVWNNKRQRVYFPFFSTLQSYHFSFFNVVIISFEPPCGDDNTGVPHAMDSKITNPKPSKSIDGRINRSELDNI